jgi:sugar phosphate isomerase/epimerase
MTEFKFGLNTSFALNRWPLPEEWISIIADDLQVKYVQFYTDMLDPVLISRNHWLRVAAKIRDLARVKSLEICSLGSGAIPHQTNFLLHPDPELRLDYVNWYKANIDLAAAMGSPAMGLYLGAFSMADIADDRRKRQLLDEYAGIMGDLSRHARERGLSYLLVEPMSIPREHPSTIAETREIYTRLNGAAVIPIYLNLDVGHLDLTSPDPADRDPYAWIRELGSSCKVLHLQQTDAAASRHWPFTAANNARGIIEADRVLSSIEATGVAEIYLIMELFYQPFGDTDAFVLSSLKESVVYWQQAIATRQRR